MKQPSLRNRPAFTLVELLVVIGIIAILISVLLPTLASARRAGYKTKCLASLHQIGDAFKMYAGENKGAWPVSVHFYVHPTLGGCDKRWHDFVSKYLIGNQSIVDPATNIKYTGNELNPNGTMGFPGSNNHQFAFGNANDPLWIGSMRDKDNVLWGCPAWLGSYNLINNVDDYRVPGYAMNRFAQSPDDLDAAGNLIQAKCAYISTNTAANPTNFFGNYMKGTQWKRGAERILIYDAVHPVGYFATSYLKKYPYLPENPGGVAMPAVADSSNFPVDYNRHGKRKIGNSGREPAANALFADGHCATVSAYEAYQGMRFCP